MAQSHGKTENLKNTLGAETLGSHCLVQDRSAHPGKCDGNEWCFLDKGKAGAGLPWETWHLEGSGADKGSQEQT